MYDEHSTREDQQNGAEEDKNQQTSMEKEVEEEAQSSEDVDVEAKPGTIEEEKKEEENVEEDIDGSASLIDGEIKVENPSGNGEPAQVLPSEGVEVWVNGEKIENKHPVYSEDQVELKVVEDIKPVQIEVNRDKEDMMAEVEVTPEYKVKYNLIDKKPSKILTIKAERLETLNRKVSREEIYEALEDNMVVYGIDENAIEELTQAEKRLSKVVARGEPMQEGVDGYAEYLVRTEKERIDYDDEATKVNLRERYYIPQVEEGEVIGVIYPAEEGIPGYKVTGEEIPPSPVSEKIVNTKEGAILSEDGTQVIAEYAGRPVVGKGKEDVVAVENIYVHNDNVDMETGNIRFQGHLKVEGSVEEGMTVFADGDIIINGNIAGAYIIGGSHVNIVGNCINSSVRAGGAYLLSQQLAEIFEYLKVSLEAALENLEQLTIALQSRGELSPTKYPHMVYKLLQTKFPEVFEFIENLNNALKERSEFSPPERVLENIEKLTKFFNDKGVMNIKDEQPFRDMFNLTDESLIELLSLTETTSDVSVNYVQNSTLECTGDINVLGPGAYHSEFHCGGKVNVNKLFRGGKIFAGDDITIGELGSPGTTYSHGLVEAPAGHSIRLGKVHEGSRIKIGDYMYRLDSTYSKIKIHLDQEEDKVKVSYW